MCGCTKDVKPLYLAWGELPTFSRWCRWCLLFASRQAPLNGSGRLDGVAGFWYFGHVFEGML